MAQAGQALGSGSHETEGEAKGVGAGQPTTALSYNLRVDALGAGQCKGLGQGRGPGMMQGGTQQEVQSHPNG